MIHYDMNENLGEFRAKTAEQYLIELIIINNTLVHHFTKEKKFTDEQLKEMIIDIEKKYGVHMNTFIANLVAQIDVAQMNNMLEKEMDNKNECI